MALGSFCFLGCYCLTWFAEIFFFHIGMFIKLGDMKVRTHGATNLELGLGSNMRKIFKRLSLLI